MSKSSKNAAKHLLFYLHLAQETAQETIAKLGDAVGYLADIDALFLEYLAEARGIKPPTAAVLMMSAHATFRAAMGLALSGQLLPTFMALRGCVEAALYANAMAMEPGLQDVWLHRDRSEDDRKACRAAFTINKIFGFLTKAHDIEFTENVQSVYDASIDFGAHPNSRSILGSTEIQELATGDHLLEFTYIHGTGSPELQRALIACAETGIRTLFIALILFSEHPSVQKLNARLLEAQNRLPALLDSLGFKHRGDDSQRA